MTDMEYSKNDIEALKRGISVLCSLINFLHKCRDAYVIIAVASDPHFAKLCEMIGEPELCRDPRFDSDPHRSENDVELKAILEKFLSNYTVAEAMEMMQQRAIPCGPLCTVDEACRNPSILKREMLVVIFTLPMPG